MRKLLRFLKDYKKESILSPLFKLLEASFELFVPLVMAAIIDTGIGNKDGGFILKMCGILILLALVGLTCSITAQYFAAKAAVGFANADGSIRPISKWSGVDFTEQQKADYVAGKAVKLEIGRAHV